MGIEHVDGKIQSGVKPPQSKKPGSGISREDAKARKVGDRVPQLPKTFCGHEGVLECSGLTELGMARARADGKIQSGVKPPQSKKPGSGLDFWKMITLASWREIPFPFCLTIDSAFRFQVSDFRFPRSPQPPKPSTLDFRLSSQSPYLRETPTAGFRESWIGA
jgi:hypothetical protein